MSLVLTRRPGEAVVVTGPPGVPPRRVYVVSIEGNVVRLAFDAPPEVRIMREELLDGRRTVLPVLAPTVGHVVRHWLAWLGHWLR